MVCDFHSSVHSFFYSLVHPFKFVYWHFGTDISQVGQNNTSSLLANKKSVCMYRLTHLLSACHASSQCISFSSPPSLPPSPLYSLCRVMDGVQTAEVSPSQKGVFQFLHSLYTNCSYLQNTFRSRFGHLCMQLGDSLLVETYAPLTTEISEWQKILQTKPR